MTTPAIVALVATLALGIAVGLLYLQRVRRKALVTAHLVAALAAGALVLAAVATGRSGGPHWGWPVGLLAGATALGYGAMRYMRGRTRAELALAAHVVLGLAGFFVFLAWSKAP